MQKQILFAAVIGAMGLAAPLVAREEAPKGVVGECGVVTFAFADQNAGGAPNPAISNNGFANGHIECFPAVLSQNKATVVLHTHINADGKLDKVDIADAGGYPSLADFAVEVMRTRLRFSPPMQDGHPVDLERDVTVSFEKHI